MDTVQLREHLLARRVNLLLRNAKIEARLRRNGVGLIVPVAGTQKAAPFRVLAQARIAIEDFEVLTDAHAVRHINMKERAS